jgi:haloacetate dehalogenase
VFEDFSTDQVSANGTTIHVRHGGAGAPVLLLHGYPQTHAMWHRVAPALARRFTVVCPDLRGYGDSAKLASDETHAAYSKRTMAQDQLEVMQSLGFERFAVVGHDRGARVARRLALDHAQNVTRLAVLDIVPTDLPERLIGADPDFYLRWTFDEWCARPDALSEDALSEYRRCFDAETIHAGWEDYRAGATIDLAHDLDDVSRGISCPVLVLWSSEGLGSSYDVLEIWRGEADDVRGGALHSGHFLAEERADETAAELLAFLAAEPS